LHRTTRSLSMTDEGQRFLEATLGLILDGEAGRAQIPLWSMLRAPLPDLQTRAEQFAARLRQELGMAATVIASESFVGGGSVPVQPIPTAAVCVGPPYPPSHGSESAWARALRSGDPPVVPRVQRGSVLFDLRTVGPQQESLLLDAIRRTWHDRGPDPGAEERG